MQSKLWKSPAIVGIKKSPTTKKEASTSPADLVKIQDKMEIIKKDIIYTV
ncbi:hypothetical protein HanPSC8_Chr08g0306671 [Helianthus annuus]|nr:hypothetical protein HanPSC8_Chr08g0306671 [Helianthus annuus]